MEKQVDATVELKRVTLEYEDGTIKELTGQKARDWYKDVDGAVRHAYVHKYRMQEHNWKIVESAK